MNDKIFAKKHVLKAAKIWDKEPRIRRFQQGSLYDVLINGKSYPPKAIASIANELATGKILFPKDFHGGFEGKWHRALAAASPDFKPILKNGRRNFTGKIMKARSLVALEAINEDHSFPEGVERKAFKLHTKRERDPKVIKLAKISAKRKTGQLCCAACGFDFGKFYGERGDGYIEGHHIKPISKMHLRGEETKVKDIALVCSNCHRMLHRIRPLITIDELKNRIKKQKAKASKQ